MAPTGTARRRGRPPGSEGRELLAIARELFLRQGFRGTTMDAIAARARTSKHTLYAAYPSKNALFAAVVRDWVDQGHDALAPPTQALAGTSDPRAGLRELAAALQAGILSPPVLQMRALIAAEADAVPEVAADYIQRSWNRNLARLAEALGTLDQRGLLAIDDATTAAEQFVWLTIAAPLNRLTLQGTPGRYSDRELKHIADEAVTTFLSRYRRHDRNQPARAGGRPPEGGADETSDENPVTPGHGTRGPSQPGVLTPERHDA